MDIIIHPGNPLRGTLHMPGDKSLSHRAALLAALAEGESVIDHFLISGVTRVMLDALAALGVEWRLEGERLTVVGRGLRGLLATQKALNCGNSATTMRMLAGALAAAGTAAELDGSPGLRRRPMERIVTPLQAMGVPIEAGAGGTAPLRLNARVEGTPLRPLQTTLPVASAQVKSCLLLAALAADPAEGKTVIREPGPSRDHTERMLRSQGVAVTTAAVVENGATWYETRLLPGAALRPLRMRLPGDISAAAFFIGAAAINPGSEVRVEGVLLNPLRTGLLEALSGMGADITVEVRSEQGGEPVGDVLVRWSPLHAAEVSGPLVVRMIDEFSVFGAAAAFAQGETVVRDAAELRNKESDRISTLCEELRGLGIHAAEAEDGFRIQGGTPRGATVQSHGDHRLAMALAVAGLAAEGPLRVEGAQIIDESNPGFCDMLRSLGADIRAVA